MVLDRTGPRWRHHPCDLLVAGYLNQVTYKGYPPIRRRRRLGRRLHDRCEGREPFQAGRYRDGLEEDFARYTAMAEDLVAECTGLGRSTAAAAVSPTVRSTTRPASQRLLKPITTKLEDKMDGESFSVPRFRVPNPAQCSAGCRRGAGREKASRS